MSSLAGRRLPALVVGFVWIVSLVLVLGNEVVSDERVHQRQISAFADGDFDLDDEVTMLPGYHAVVAVPVALSGSDSPDVARLATVAIGLVGVWVMHVATRERGVSLLENRTALQWAVLPIAAPYAFLVFTDQLAALTVLAVWVLLRGGRIEWAGVAAAAAVFVRQTSIVWAAGLCALDLVQRGGSISCGWALLRDWANLRRYWTFLAPIGIVATLLAVNGGVAVGDSDLHRVGFYPENVLFAIMVLGGLFWPLLLDLTRPTPERLRVWAGFGVVAVGVYVLAWDPDHPFNLFGGKRFPRNWLLTNSVDRRPVWLLLLVALVFGLWVLSRIELRPGASHLIYPLAGAALIPQQLVEQRYYIAAVMMLMVLRRPGSERAELMLGAWWALVTFGIAVGMFGLDRFVI